MNSFIVVWMDEGHVIATAVEIPTDKNPEDLSNKDWVSLAADMEGCNADEIEELLDEGFNLFAVIKGTAENIIM